jgi:hypothetical protein
MKKLPGLRDVNSDQQNGGLDILLNYDRVTAAKLGQTAQSLDSGIYSAFGQSEVSIIYTQLNQYYVVLEVDPAFSQTPDGLKNIYFHQTAQTNPTATGNTPLLTMAKSQTNTTPRLLCRDAAGLPAIAELGTYPGRNRAARGVHRVGRFIREPRSSTDHHFYFAIGERRSHARADDVQARSQRDLYYWHCAAHWHREEECHHDD